MRTSIVLISLMILILASYAEDSVTHGVLTDLPPYMFINKSGQVDGYYVELFKEIYTTNFLICNKKCRKTEKIEYTIKYEI